MRHLKLSGAEDYGGLAVLVDVWRCFALDRFKSDLGTTRQQGLLQAMVLGRIVFFVRQTRGGRAGRGHNSGRGLPAPEDFDEDELYEAMDLANGR